MIPGQRHRHQTRVSLIPLLSDTTEGCHTPKQNLAAEWRGATLPATCTATEVHGRLEKHHNIISELQYNRQYKPDTNKASHQNITKTKYYGQRLALHSLIYKSDTV